ncbi:hypothetical protein [Granulicoccus sp. GXG6511]|uniref:hypothetical protein n=1 Tax=Granulicoccus sp. GXG6511 TaxID=3381351 RepID=UPI003D7D0646
MTKDAVQRLARAVVAGLLLTLLVGCLSSRPNEPLASPSRAQERIHPVWESERDYLSAGRIHGDRILTVGAGEEPGRIDLVGLDLATGRELWRHPWSPSADEGFPVSTLAVEAGGDHYAVFMADGDEQRDGDALPHQRLIMVRLSDGALQEIHPAVWTASQPRHCAPGDADAEAGDVDQGGPRRLCLAAHLFDEGWRWLEITPGTGTVEVGEVDGGYAHLHGGWVVTRTDIGRTDPNELLGRIEAGKVIWTKASAQFFEGTLGRSAFSYDISTDADQPALFLLDASAGGLEGARMVAISPRDGSVAWSRAGVVECRARLRSDDPGLVSLCFRRGETGHPDARLVLALVDRRTGQVATSHVIDAAAANLDDQAGRYPWAGKDEVVVTVDGRERVLHATKGLHGPFDRSAALCGEWTHAAHRFFPDRPLRVGSRAVRCDGNDDADRALGRAQLEAWADDEGWLVLLRGDRVHAYRK